MKSKHIIAVLLILTASVLPEILLPSRSTTITKIIILVVATIIFLLVKNLRPLFKFSIVLLMIDVSFVLVEAIKKQAEWIGMFSGNALFTSIESNVGAKVIGIIPVLAILFLLLKSPDNFYLKTGNLTTKAEPINWLGIGKDKISWGKLALISGVLITLGTLLLTMLTSTGFTVPKGIERLLPSLPLILLLALVNSFCEGFIFRMAIMGPLKEQFSKSFVVMMSALFFGIAHYMGTPGGILGGIMSGVLGWYMARSMYETKGFATAWIIHFMQDVTIFSALVVLTR